MAQQGMSNGQYGMQPDSNSMQQAYGGIQNKGFSFFFYWNNIKNVSVYGMNSNDPKMNGGGHHMGLSQQQSLPQQQMMSGNGVDQQMMQQQRMWGPNGPLDQHGRPLYQTPIGGQLHSNQPGKHFITSFFASAFRTILFVF